MSATSPRSATPPGGRYDVLAGELGVGPDAGEGLLPTADVTPTAEAAPVTDVVPAAEVTAAVDVGLALPPVPTVALPRRPRRPHRRPGPRSSVTSPPTGA